MAAIAAALTLILVRQSTEIEVLESPSVAPPASAIAAITSVPHIVYRHTGVDAS